MDPKSVAFPARESIGLINAVIGGKLHRNVPNTLTFVEEESDLAVITDAQPGDFAATFGLGSLWQYDGSAWQEV